MFSTPELVNLENEKGVGKIQSVNYEHLIISNSVKAVLTALQSFKMPMKIKRKLAISIIEKYPSLKDINNTHVILFFTNLVKPLVYC